ncbi:MAG: type II/IV secretion system ATPase subunit [Candidatus Pacearchaeota archaeon]|nr:type II/IV secretion system ATPase subunit [Candidatus Pacearchaeota archaeon]
MVIINPNPAIPALHRLEDKASVDIRYSLISPYANAHIYWDKEEGDLVYDLEEPILNEQGKIDLKRLEDAMIELINVNVAVERSVEQMSEYIDKTAKLLISELNLKIKEEDYEKIFYYLYRDFIGINEVEPLLRDYFIEDIECNGTDTPIYIVHRLYRNIRTTIKFRDPEKLAGFVEKLAQRAGKYVSYSEPLLDGSLPDGSRVNATYTKDVTSRGPTFTIRKFTKVPWTPTQLIALNTLSPEMLAYFWILVQYKSNIFIAGGTASGKTTLLNALAFFIPPESRIVSIEDTRELKIPKENWIPAVSRIAIGRGGVGEIDLFDLLKNSFRQNPDYVIVGEVRGKEAFVLFQGMASGHPSISTMHADSVDTLIKRLETPPIELSPTLVNTLDCVAIMSHAIVKNKETRRLRECVEIINAKADGSALVNTPFVWNPSQDVFYFKKQSKVFEKISVRYGIPMDELYEEFSKRAKLLYNLYKKKVFGFDEMKKIVTDYYKNPSAVLSKYEVDIR